MDRIASIKIKQNDGTYKDYSLGVPIQNIINLQTAVQSKADATTVNTLSGTVTNLQTTKADKSYVDTAISAAVELPTGGTIGDFLRKTANGVAWETVQTWQGGSY